MAKKSNNWRGQMDRGGAPDPGEPFRLPPPGLQGTYGGSCVVCLQGCDTGLAFWGEAEWIIAGMTNLGIPQQEALIMLEDAFGCPPGTVPDGQIELPLTVCEACMARSGLGMPLGLIAGDKPLPCIVHGKA
jgi:hypothetical protein